MIIERFEKNPILKPDKSQSWEAEAVFNGCPIKKGEKVFLLYRAISLPHYHMIAKKRLEISNVGIAESEDGLNFYNRKRLIKPELEWEKFGCEDPRVTKLNDKYYIFYTALSNWPPKTEDIRVGLAISSDLEKIDEKHLVTPFNAKAMALFPEKIKGKMWAILTVNTDKPPAKICLVSFDTEEEIWQEYRWETWYQDFEKYSLPLTRRPQDHAEVGAPPVKTPHGWILVYSYIRNYFSSNKIFGIEAVLLDLEDPLKIIGRTDFSLLTPEEYYEKHGMVQNIVFPSGVLIRNKVISIYYGAADTTCAVFFVGLEALISKLLKKTDHLIKLQRAETNPIITPNKNHPWEEKLTFNPAAVYLDGKVHLLYRAMSKENTSVIGYATSQDGVHIDYRHPEPIYTPNEPFELKHQSGANSGVEDPRIVKIDHRIYMFYTAFDGKNPPRVALTSILVDDFLKQKWDWSCPVLISPAELDNKDAAMFPERIGGEYLIIHRMGDDIDLSFHKNLNFDGETWLEEYRWVLPRSGWWDSKKVGISAPPIKTDEGWVLIYHGVSEDDWFYRVGALLTDLRDPTKIIGRTDYPIFEPEADYEKNGEIPNVVFPCGAVNIEGTLFLYYGGADQVCGVATVKMTDLLCILKACKY